MWKDIIIGVAFLGALTLTWIIFEVCSSKDKWLIKISRGPLFWITDRPIGILILCYLTICGLLILEVVFKPLDLKDDSIVLICISIIGFVGTIIGLIATYFQLKRNNNQFYGYSDFYRFAEVLLTQKSKKTIKFHFSTPIPGHIAYNTMSDFLSFQNQLTNYQGNIEFIIPNENMIKEMYYKYKDQQIAGQEQKYTEELINKMLSRSPYESEFTVESFVTTLRKKEKNVKVYVYKTTNESDKDTKKYDKKPEVIENLYLSDGRVAIYAIPLHFLNIQDGVSGKTNTKPALVGFVTTDRHLVSTLENNFDLIRDDAERCTLLDKNTPYLQFSLDN